jgi:dihydrofolate synthase/folylpolyglutamate synthase
MSYSAAADYLYSLQKQGIKLGLEKTAGLLCSLGNPHQQFKCIHVAGTNGKGSVSAMTAAILRAHGFRVGLFTSPHLVSFTERIRVNEKEISEAEVIELTDEIRYHACGRETDPVPTFFEFVTTMALVYFARQGVDWAVIETGMGGRLDATNIIVPEVSVITSISRDHTEFLGAAIAEIAAEKAGIIKTGVPVVTAPQPDEAYSVIERTARERSAPLFTCGINFWGISRDSMINGNRFDYIDETLPGNIIRGLFVPLAGDYQIINASIAIKTVFLALSGDETCGTETGETIMAGEEAERAFRTGLASAILRGRIEFLKKEPPVIIDVAHNAGAAAALAGFVVKHLADRRVILVIGIMADKDIKAILDALRPVSDEIILTAPAYARAESPGRLADLAEAAGFTDIVIAATVTDAVEKAVERQACCRDESGRYPVVLVTGSFYTTGEAIEAFGERASMGTLRETL